MHMPAGVSGMCMRESKQGKSDDDKTYITGEGRIGGKYQVQKRKAQDF